MLLCCRGGFIEVHNLRTLRTISLTKVHLLLGPRTDHDIHRRWNLLSGARLRESDLSHLAVANYLLCWGVVFGAIHLVKALSARQVVEVLVTGRLVNQCGNSQGSRRIEGISGGALLADIPAHVEKRLVSWGLCEGDVDLAGVVAAVLVADEGAVDVSEDVLISL